MPACTVLNFDRRNHRTIHHYTETATPDATKRYPSDLNDREFGLVAPHVAKRPPMATANTVTKKDNGEPHKRLAVVSA